MYPSSPINLNTDVLAIVFQNSDVRSAVFRNSEPGTLFLCRKVCHDWRKAVTADIRREVINKCFALGVNEYKEYFNHDVESIDLPLNIHDEIMELYNFSVINGVNKAPILALIDPNLNLKKIGELVKSNLQESKNGFDYILPELIVENGNKEQGKLNEKPYWVLMMNGVMGRYRSYDKQKALVKYTKKSKLTNYQVPTAEEVAFCIYLERVALKKSCEFGQEPSTYTRTQSEIGGHQICVGGFMPAGLNVHNCRFDQEFIGVAALRKF